MPFIGQSTEGYQLWTPQGEGGWALALPTLLRIFSANRGNWLREQPGERPPAHPTQLGEKDLTFPDLLSPSLARTNMRGWHRGGCCLAVLSFIWNIKPRSRTALNINHPLDTHEEELRVLLTSVSWTHCTRNAIINPPPDGGQGPLF